jgi:hypothetical protein
MSTFVCTTAQTKGNPASAQPMPGLSKRAQKLLAPVRTHFCTPIEPAGAGLRREVMRKASI